jgi:hypothetical protein
MNKYVDIKEACLLVGKSANTIRRLALELKANGSENVQIELMKNGAQKLLIKQSFLLTHFKVTKNKNLVGKEQKETGSGMVDFLKSQLEIKDRQIEQLTQLLALEKQEKQNLIEAPKKRKFLFWRNK